MFKLFPHTPTCLELTHANNMRFMHFIPFDKRMDKNSSEFKKVSCTNDRITHLYKLDLISVCKELNTVPTESIKL